MQGDRLAGPATSSGAAVVLQHPGEGGGEGENGGRTWQHSLCMGGAGDRWKWERQGRDVAGTGGKASRESRPGEREDGWEVCNGTKAWAWCQKFRGCGIWWPLVCNRKAMESSRSGL